MSFSISGKTAIVTGAANGVGLAIARHFAAAGANVVFADRDESKLRDELGEISEDSNVRWFAGDLRKKLTIANLLSATIDAFDRVDILVNAARQVEPSNPLEPKEDMVAELMDQNLMCSLRLSQAVAKRMIAQSDGDAQDQNCLGSIINLSSIAARHTHPALLAYSMSAAALEQMTRTLAVALAPERIRVNAVAIGSVLSTSLLNELKANDNYRAEIVSHTPMGRIAPPSEVAEVAQFFASESSAFVTGQVLNVDGGRTLIDPVAVPAH